MIALIFEAALRALLLAAAVWLTLRLLDIREARTELSAWTLVLFASLAMPFLMQLSLFMPSFLPSAAEISLPSISAMPLWTDTPVAAAIPPKVVVSAAGVSGISWLRIAVGVYLSISAVFLLRFAMGLILTWRITEKSQPVHDEWTAGHDVRVNPGVATPMTFWATILLPRAYPEWSAAKRRAVMAHEGAHVRHNDFYIHVLSSLYRAVFWFNPLSWWLNKKLSELAESISDDAAIANIGDRTYYAELLLDISRDAQELPMAVAMAKTPIIHRRVERVIDEVPALLGPKRKMLALAGLVPLLVLTAGINLKAAAALPPPIAKAASLAKPVSQIQKVNLAPAETVTPAPVHVVQVAPTPRVRDAAPAAAKPQPTEIAQIVTGAAAHDVAPTPPINISITDTKSSCRMMPSNDVPPPATPSAPAGIAAAQKSDFALARANFRPLAEQGDPIGERLYGTLLLQDCTGFQDKAAAIVMLTKASDAGDMIGSDVLARAYMSGNGVAQDDNKAFALFTKASNADIARAQVDLGYMYLSGRGTPRDLYQGMVWSVRAGEQGMPVALLNVAEAYYKGAALPQDNDRAAYFMSAAVARMSEADKTRMATTINNISRAMSQDQLARTAERAKRWAPGPKSLSDVLSDAQKRRDQDK